MLFAPARVHDDIGLPSLPDASSLGISGWIRLAVAPALMRRVL